MNIGRSAILTAGGVEPPKTAGAKDALSKLSEAMAARLPAQGLDFSNVKAPNVDVTGLSQMGANAWSKVSEATKEGFSNFIGGGWDPLGPPVVGASGPVVRDISLVYDSTFENQKQMASNVNKFVNTFEKRTQRYEAQLQGSEQQLKKCLQSFEVCSKKSDNIDKASDALRSACKSIQEKLQCESTCETQRTEAELARAKKVEEIKAAFTADVNKKREQIEQGFKDQENQLMDKYKEESTEGFV